MTETTAAKTKKYPQIELPRPGLSWRRFWLVIAVCFGVMLLIGIGLSFAQGIGRTDVGKAAEDFPAVYDLPDTWKFIGPAIVVAVLAGLGFGWAWKRPIKPRIEMYEVDTASQVVKRGRRRVSTALTRTTY